LRPALSVAAVAATIASVALATGSDDAGADPGAGVAIVAGGASGSSAPGR